jgi:hypothetical protein
MPTSIVRKGSGGGASAVRSSGHDRNGGLPRCFFVQFFRRLVQQLRFSCGALWVVKAAISSRGCCRRKLPRKTDSRRSRKRIESPSKASTRYSV